MRTRSFNFRWHLATFGLIILVPILLACAVISSLYVTSERASMERQVLTAARVVANAIDRQQDAALTALRMLALSPSLRRGDLDSFDLQARSAAEIFPLSVIGLRTVDGRHLMHTAAERGSALPASTDPILQEADRQALRIKEPIVSGLHTGPVTGRLFISIVLPVEFNGEQHLLTWAMPPDEILETVRNARALPDDWLVVVSDKTTRIIARTRDHERLVGKHGLPEFFAKLTGPEGIVTSTTRDNVGVLDGYTRSAISGWTVIAAAPLTHYWLPIRRAILSVGLVAAFGIVTSLVIAALYAAFITRPIWRLRDQALAMRGRTPPVPFRTGITELDAVSTALSQAATSLNSLINELNHRVKNSLATVQSIARQTAVRASDMPEFNRAFTGRLVALSRSHDILSDAGWITADMRDLVATVCGAICDDGRVEIDGPGLALPPRMILTLGMVLHELSTNAAKYGALVSEQGRVKVSWTVTTDVPRYGGPVLTLDWKERGGPKVMTPRHSGFGSKFIVASIRYDLHGSATLDYGPEGLDFHAEIPLRPVAVAAAA